MIENRMNVYARVSLGGIREERERVCVHTRGLDREEGGLYSVEIWLAAVERLLCARF